MLFLIIFFVALLIIIALLYLYAIMPGVDRKRRGQFGDFATVYYAHRGLHVTPGDAPENSIAAFTLAADQGFGIELDIQLCKDGQVVVFHDETLERICGVTGRLLDFSYEELSEFTLCGTQEKIPLLKDVLDLVAGRVPLIIEYKIVDGDMTVCALGDALLRQYQGAYCIESFHPFALRWYRKNHPAVIRGQLADRFTAKSEYRHLKYWLLQNLLLNFLTRPDFIAFNHEHRKMWSRSLCQKLWRNPAVAWTLYQPEELTQAKKHFDWFIFEGFAPLP
ncbi:MAG: glycerophosphodiester phosphodiesterase [Lachnospiraceae bacterium]|jgi:glycerophosphoryl diester phosphodiesterase|nr:glycerophosphodiester phosphodiesterase [Lachnospiraceae bacterium]